MKAYIITIDGNSYSVDRANRCRESIRKHECEITPTIAPAVTPKTVDVVMDEIFGKRLEYTYPKKGEFVRKSIWGDWEAMHLVGYATDNIDTIKATAISHAFLWKHCVDVGEPILILEHDALFIRKFSPSELGDFSEGACSLNDPLGATRMARVYRKKLQSDGRTVVPCPKVDEYATGSIPPQGLPGNSAYVITPGFAKKLLAVMEYSGVWPNDAMMCRQLFPNMLYCLYPYATVVNQTKSTSQGQ